MSNFNPSAASDSPSSNSTDSAHFKILARRPVLPVGCNKTEIARSPKTDPLRETLPWPLPEKMQEQLSRGDAIRETIDFTTFVPQSH
jgi:hypothetical protein